MKKEKILTSSVLAFLIALGLFFTIDYFTFYVSNTRHILYLIIAVLAMVETLFAGLSLYFCLRSLKNRFVSVTYILLVICAIPICFIAVFRVLWFAGMQIPPQQ